MSVAALAVLLVHLFTKPFQSMWINVIEALILLDLLMVTVAFLDPSNTPVPFGFSAFLLLLPYVYAIGYLLYRAIGKKLWYVASTSGTPYMWNQDVLFNQDSLFCPLISYQDTL